MQVDLQLTQTQVLLEAMNKLAQDRQLEDAELELIQHLEEVHHQLAELSEIDLDECEGGACKM